MDLLTKVDIPASELKFSLSDRIVVLGSCFADGMGRRMQRAGFNVCLNPFGTLYNPVSIANSIARLRSGIPFSEKDCIRMGAGSDLICSFSHHTSFARPSAEEFLQAANSALEEASAFWQSADKVIITLGTAWCWKCGGEVVSNCLKRPASEFTRERLEVESIRMVLDSIESSNPDKQFLFTVSPIRHLSDGAHSNQLSKASLLLATEGRRYFPSYEIMLDELRDYRFWAEDMVHPTSQAVEYIWERFRESCTLASEAEIMRQNEKKWRASQHRQLHSL